MYKIDSIILGEDGKVTILSNNMTILHRTSCSCSFLTRSAKDIKRFCGLKTLNDKCQCQVLLKSSFFSFIFGLADHKVQAHHDHIRHFSSVVLHSSIV